MAHRAVTFAIAQLSCYSRKQRILFHNVTALLAVVSKHLAQGLLVREHLPHYI